jgi:hypothetical protein
MIRYSRKEDVVARSVAGTNLLVPANGSTKDVFTLNNTGAWLWNALEEPCTLDELVAALIEDYPNAKETAKTDLTAFLDEMVASELVATEEA